MKIKFELDMEDVVCDLIDERNDDIVGEVKNQIINTCVRKVIARCQDSIEREINNRVNDIVKAKVESMIEKSIDKVVNSDAKIIQGRTIIEQAQHLFTESRTWNSLPDAIIQKGEKFCKELKSKYDAAFANRVVMGMKDQGLLKDDVVKMLLK